VVKVGEDGNTHLMVYMPLRIKGECNHSEDASAIQKGHLQMDFIILNRVKSDDRSGRGRRYFPRRV
jgi:hypothetical protein